MERTVVVGTLLFCLVLVLVFSLLSYSWGMNQGAAVLISLLAAFVSEWFYRRYKTRR